MKEAVPYFDETRLLLPALHMDLSMPAQVQIKSYQWSGKKLLNEIYFFLAYKS